MIDDRPIDNDLLDMPGRINRHLHLHLDEIEEDSANHGVDDADA